MPHLADLRHLRLADVPVLVHVEQREGPLQLPGGLPRGRHVQCNDVLLEVQGSVVVGVERAEDVSRVALGVAFGEKAAVDLLELFGSDAPRRALLLEVLVPLADLGFGEFGGELQVLQDLLRYRAAGGISHGGLLSAANVPVLVNSPAKICHLSCSSAAPPVRRLKASCWQQM